MKVRIALIAIATIMFSIVAQGTRAAPVDLSTYADANGWINVQTLTCDQLANTWQQDADFLTVWYSGWYNGLAKRHSLNIHRVKQAEHEVIVYCKAHRQLRIIQAIDVVFKSMRKQMGIKMK